MMTWWKFSKDFFWGNWVPCPKPAAASLFFGASSKNLQLCHYIFSENTKAQAALLPISTVWLDKIKSIDLHRHCNNLRLRRALRSFSVVVAASGSFWLSGPCFATLLFTKWRLWHTTYNTIAFTSWYPLMTIRSKSQPSRDLWKQKPG